MYVCMYVCMYGCISIIIMFFFFSVSDYMTGDSTQSLDHMTSNLSSGGSTRGRPQSLVLPQHKTLGFSKV